jgi:sugar phosphate isomerase/epimerase
MKNLIILHCNAVEQGQTILEMCQRAVVWGYDGIEFRRRRSDVTETPEQYLDAIAQAKDATGLKHVLFGGPGPDLMLSDAAKRRSEVEECVRFYEAAASRFELTVCNTMTGTLVAPNINYYEFDRHGSAIVTEEQWQWAVEGFQVLGDLAARLKFRFAFETHNCYLHDLPQPSRRLVDRINRPAVGINLDFGNILINPKKVSLRESIAICAERIYEIHLKNLYLLPVTKYYNFISCPLADGAINNREMLRELRRIGYAGPYVIETPREGDREYFARQDLRYFKELLPEV